MQKLSSLMAAILGLWLSLSNAATPNIRVCGDYEFYGGGQARVPSSLTNAVATYAGGNQGGLLNLALKPDKAGSAFPFPLKAAEFTDWSIKTHSRTPIGRLSLSLQAPLRA